MPKFSRFYFLALFLFTACGDQTSKTYDESRDNSLRSVLGGTPPPAGSQISKRTVMIRYKGNFYCTGTLVTTTAVVTAGHCVVSTTSPYGLLNYADFTIGFGPNGNTYVRSATQLVKHVNYNYDPSNYSPNYDIALIKFSGGIPSGYEVSTFLDPMSLPPFTSINVVHAGYGYKTPTGDYGTLLEGTDNPTLSFYSPSVVQMYNTPNASCSGDSGGPYFVLDGTEYVQFGTHSGSNCKGAPPYTNYGEDIRGYISWMTSNGATPKTKLVYSGLYASLFTSSGSGYYTELPPTRIGYSCPGLVFTASMQGNGKDSIVQVCKNSSGNVEITPYHWNGGNYVKGSKLTTAKKYGGQFLVLDFNGDGKKDLAYLYPNSSYRLALVVYKSNGSSFSQAYSNLDMNQGYTPPFFAAHLNKAVDNFEDIIQIWNNSGTLGMITYKSTSTAYNFAWGTGNMFQGYTLPIFGGDVNGDGNGDLIQTWNGGGTLSLMSHLADGNFALNWKWGANTYQGATGLYLPFDIDGDKRTDILQPFKGGTNIGVVVHRSDGLGYNFEWGSSNIGLGFTGEFLTGDTNADGKSDMIQLWNNGGNVAVNWIKAVYSSNKWQLIPTSGATMGSPYKGYFLPVSAWNNGRTDVLQVYSDFGEFTTKSNEGAPRFEQHMTEVGDE